jgi:hypothetical protein
LTANWPNDALVVRTKELFKPNDWKHLAITYDGSGKAAGLQLYLNGVRQELEVLQDKLTASIKSTGELLIGTKVASKGYSGSIDDLRLYEGVLTAAEVGQLAVNYPIQTILSGVSGKRSKEESDRLRTHFLTRIAPEIIRQQYDELNRLKEEKTALDAAITNTMVMMESNKPRETYILARGDYRNKTEKVTPSVPAVLPPLPAGAPANRLALAKWLVDPQHPLTARVAVNRYWQMYFGVGLVKTAEDFGAQGELPAIKNCSIGWRQSLCAAAGMSKQCNA